MAETEMLSDRIAEVNGPLMPEQQVLESKYEKKPFSLEVRWQSGLSLLHNGHWQRSLTQKERGQLKNLANALGARTHEVMDWALENWSTFAHRAESAAGLATSPTEPNIGFLLKHCGVAVQEMQAIAEKKKKDEELKAVFQKSQAELAAAAVEKAAQLDAENQKAIEEMLAMFAAAGEQPPLIQYNDRGEVIYRVTKKELSATLASFRRH